MLSKERNHPQHINIPPPESDAPIVAMSNSQKASSFFSFPAELRLQIYHYVCEEIAHTCRLRLHIQDNGKCLQPCAYGGLLRTCKQIYIEMLPFIYSERRIYSFLIPPHEDTVGFSAPEPGLQLMKHVDLKYVFPDCHDSDTDAIDAHIASYISRFRSVRTLTLQLFRWVEGPFLSPRNRRCPTAAALAALEIEECLCVAVHSASRPDFTPFLDMLCTVAPIIHWTFLFGDEPFVYVPKDEVRAWWYPKEKTAGPPSV